MFLEIVRATYLEDYKISLEFNNGETYVVDFRTELNGTMFLPLKNIDLFRNFRIVFNTIEWKNGADFAPEYLYELAHLQNKIAGEPKSEYKISTKPNTGVSH